MKFKVLGITKEAASNLSPRDEMSLVDFIGCVVSPSDELGSNNGMLLIMPDGELTHERFLDLARIS